jgi:hypothetical protein
MARTGGNDHSRWRPQSVAGRLAVAGVAAMLAVPAGAAAASAGVRHPQAVPSGPELLAWGSNTHGELGNGQAGASSSLPTPASLPSGTRLAQVTAGCDHVVALTPGGQVLSWGANNLGQLGVVAASDPEPFPVVVPIPATIRSVKAGCSDSVALDTSGHVWTWGSNANGDLGTGSQGAFRMKPAKIKFPKGTVVKAISAGDAFGVALTTSGKLFSWGLNDVGELGDGQHVNSSTPVRVHLPSGMKVTAISAGSDHTVALTSTGKVLAWGWNHFAQLGNGTRRDSSLPITIAMPRSVRKVTQVFGGGLFSLALTSTGRLLSWGSNGFGELGDGTFTDRLRPVRVHQGNVAVTSVAAGGLFVVARTSSSDIMAWGFDSGGELGDNDSASRNLPVRPLVGIGDVVAVGAGNSSFSGFAIMH